MGGYNPQNDWIGQLYHENFKPLYRYAKNALNDPSIAEEATQEVFCLACVKSEELSQSNNPQGWLMNTLKNLIRSTKREREKRELIDAVLYFVDYGCKWRNLPHDFPPYTTVV